MKAVSFDARRILGRSELSDSIVRVRDFSRIPENSRSVIARTARSGPFYRRTARSGRGMHLAQSARTTVEEPTSSPASLVGRRAGSE